MPDASSSPALQELLVSLDRQQQVAPSDVAESKSLCAVSNSSDRKQLEKALLRRNAKAVRRGGPINTMFGD